MLRLNLLDLLDTVAANDVSIAIHSIPHSSETIGLLTFDLEF